MAIIIILISNYLVPGFASEKSITSYDTSNPPREIAVEKWAIFEIRMIGTQKGNPFRDVEVSAEFSNGDRVYRPQGFYDGSGIFKVRFMPTREGIWQFVTKSNRKDLNGVQGRFLCVEACKGNHGPVRVRNTIHMEYADGTPYRQIGTTCYVWTHQPDVLIQETLASLANSPFNKIRMMIFPQDNRHNQNDPRFYAFPQNKNGTYDFTRFNPEFFEHFEKHIMNLAEMGIEADIILFHPYDRWGFENMGAETDDFYTRYVVNRLSAFRNVWWSMANEYELVKTKTVEDWDRLFEVVVNHDSYGHMLSIHNWLEFYDYRKTWITHLSIQTNDFTEIEAWQEEYKKPIIYDETRYEGNIPYAWGNQSAREMSHKFWLGMVAGCYVGHGETYEHPDDILWWSKGGKLYGKSPARIEFLKIYLDQAPPDGIMPLDKYTGGKPGDYYLAYFGEETPSQHTFRLAPYVKYQVEIIDTWGMTSTLLPDTYSEVFQIDLPEKPYMAVRIRKAGYDFPALPVEAAYGGTSFYDELFVKLSQANGCAIHYTLDGSLPSAQSPLYHNAIRITEDNTILNAVAVCKDGRKSRIETRTYHRVKENPGVSLKITASLKHGVKYQYFEGNWQVLPDFQQLSVKETGVLSDFNISKAKREDYYGFTFEALIQITRDDLYTFYTQSDDGSKLWVDGTLLLDNDGQHVPIEKSGRICLEKGMHHIRVEYFENIGDQDLTVLYESPVMEKKKIPARVLFCE